MPSFNPNDLPEEFIQHLKRAEVVAVRKPCRIIAEFGTYWTDGSGVDHAINKLKHFANQGGEAVKFQIFNAEETALPNTEYFHSLKKAEPSVEDLERLIAHAGSFGLQVGMTLTNHSHVPLVAHWTHKGLLQFVKLGSPDFTNNYLLQRLVDECSPRVPVFLSSGGSSGLDFALTLAHVKKLGIEQRIRVLHCQSEYPPAGFDWPLFGDFLSLIREIPGVTWGISAHCPDHDLIRQLAMIAPFIEVHVDGGHDDCVGVPAPILGGIQRQVYSVCETYGLPDLSGHPRLAFHGREDRDLILSARMYARVRPDLDGILEEETILTDLDIAWRRGYGNEDPNKLIHGARWKPGIWKLKKGVLYTPGQLLNLDNLEMAVSPSSLEKDQEEDEL